METPLKIDCLVEQERASPVPGANRPRRGDPKGQISFLAAKLAVIAAIALGFGTGARAETLSQALARAYTDNPRLVAQRARLRATDELVAQALSNWRPTLTGRGDFGRSKVDSQLGFFASDTIRNPRSLSANLSQPIFRGLRTLAQTRQAKNTVLAERALLTSVEQDILFDGATAYMNVVRDQAVLELNINNEQVLRRQLQAARDRFEVGEVTRTDVAQAEARLARAVADRIQGRGALAASRANYKNVIGTVPEKLEQPTVGFDLPDSLAEAVEQASSDNPNVAVAKFTEKAARDGVDNVFGELLPTVTVEGDISRDLDKSSRGSRNTSMSIVGRLTVPLYQAGGVSSRIREAKQISGQRRMEVAAARRDAIEAATRAWENLQTTRARIKALESETEANEIALEGVTQEAAAGLRTVLDVLDAEQELLDANVNLVRAKRDDVVARFELRRAVGRLTAGLLNLSAEPYDVDANYNRVKGKIFGVGDGLPPLKE